MVYYLAVVKACDTIPPGDSIPDYFGYHEEETDTTFSLQDILDRRFHQDFALGGFNRCSQMVCDTLECDSITKLQQLTDITEILQMMKDSLLEENTIVCEGTSLLTTYTANARSYLIPSKLFRIRLCDGSEYYIPEQFLDELSGTYEIIQEIPVTDINQTFNIQNKSRSSRATLSEYCPILRMVKTWR